MTGSRGPVPKRSEQRRRTNKDDAPVTKGASAQAAGIPPPEADWNELARGWYLSLAKSGQSAWYEPSDWAEARVWAQVLSDQLESGRPSAVMLASWSSACARLLVTEGDRRRMRLELERGKAEDPDTDAGVAQMDAWRERLGAGG